MFTTFHAAVTLFSLLPLSGSAQEKKIEAAPPAKPAASGSHPRQVRLQFAAFELEVQDPTSLIAGAERLRGIATDAEFEKALADLGKPQRHCAIDRMADLSEPVQITMGASMPIVTGKTLVNNNPGVSLQYKDVGCLIDILPAAMEPGSSGILARFQVDLSTVVDSHIETGEDIRSPIFTKWKSTSTVHLEFGKPSVTIDFIGLSKDETSRAVVMRYVATEVK